VGQYIETVAGVARLLRRAAELAWTQADVAGPRFWRALAQVVQPCHRDPGPHKSVAAAIAHVAREVAAWSSRHKALADAGVSIWLDDLSRERITSGNLADLVGPRWSLDGGEGHAACRGRGCRRMR
jgi:hypothetical protein